MRDMEDYVSSVPKYIKMHRCQRYIYSCKCEHSSNEYRYINWVHLCSIHCRYRVSSCSRHLTNAEANACQLGLISGDDQLLSRDKRPRMSIFQCDSTASQQTLSRRLTDNVGLMIYACPDCPQNSDNLKEI